MTTAHLLLTTENFDEFYDTLKNVDKDLLKGAENDLYDRYYDYWYENEHMGYYELDDTFDILVSKIGVTEKMFLNHWGSVFPETLDLMFEHGAQISWLSEEELEKYWWHMKLLLKHGLNEEIYNKILDKRESN